MPVLSDFIRIVGDSAQTIGNSAVELNFNTGGRASSHDALLVFSVKGLNTTVPVKVNNAVVGSLTPNSTQNHWFTQMVYMGGGGLNDGNNELQLEAVNNDGFQIRQVSCFFGQSA
jgi:hypothetical protein